MSRMWIFIALIVFTTASGCGSNDEPNRCMDFCNRMGDCNREFALNECRANCLIDEEKELVPWLRDCMTRAGCAEFLSCVQEGEPS